jgi:hypothetical protein
MKRIVFTVGTLLASVLSGCQKLTGFNGAVSPLAIINLQVTGDPASLTPPPATGDQLQVALVWGDEWQPEPFCLLPPENDQVAAVIAAGCRDPFGFVPIPSGVAANVGVQLGAPAEIELFNPPLTNVEVGALGSAVAYGNLIFYDDRNGNGTLDLGQASHTPSGGRNRGGDDGDNEPTQVVDYIYGASFITMTAPDQRVAFVDGVFTQTTFYPRSGCPNPPPYFSILSAGGFSAAAGLAAAEASMLPAEDPSTCTPQFSLNADNNPPTPTVTIPAPAAVAGVAETACVERVTDSSTRYREPPADAPDLTNRISACAHLPTFDSGTSAGDVMQLVVSGRSDDACQGLSHYTLRGCNTDPSCTVPTWDLTASPPAWWPCPQAQ